jgi:hypothetical protein
MIKGFFAFLAMINLMATTERRISRNPETAAFSVPLLKGTLLSYLREVPVDCFRAWAIPQVFKKYFGEDLE